MKRIRIQRNADQAHQYQTGRRRSHRHPKLHASGRHGMAVIDVVLSTAITFAFAFAMYLVAQTSSGFVYQFISTMVGSPYM